MGPAVASHPRRLGIDGPLASTALGLFKSAVTSGGWPVKHSTAAAWLRSSTCAHLLIRGGYSGLPGSRNLFRVVVQQLALHGESESGSPANLSVPLNLGLVHNLGFVFTNGFGPGPFGVRSNERQRLSDPFATPTIQGSRLIQITCKCSPKSY